MRRHFFACGTSYVRIFYSVCGCSSDAFPLMEFPWTWYHRAAAPPEWTLSNRWVCHSSSSKRGVGSLDTIAANIDPITKVADRAIAPAETSMWTML